MKQRATPQRRTIFLASTLILASIALAVVILCATVQYRQAFQRRREQLAGIVKVHARLIEVANRQGEMKLKPNRSPSNCAAMLSQIIDAHEHYPGFGRTGEIMLAQRREGRIVFLLRHRNSDVDELMEIPWDSENAQPMRYALSGRSGTLVGSDYRGNRVLAAYEPVQGIGLGVVAKIDTRELLVPFVEAGIAIGTLAVLMIAVGSFCFFRIADPMARHVGASEAKERAVRMRIERALERAQYESELIFNAADPLCLIDTNCGISRVNDRFCELFGVRREEVLGKRCSDLWPTAICHTERCPLRRIAAGETRVDFEADYARDDGSVFSCAVTSIPYRYWGGELLGIVKNFVDITQRKQAEVRLKEKNDDLETLFYVTSHDLREPLRTIRNFAELIDSRYADRLDDKGRDFLSRIIRGANRLDRLVGDILTHSRAQRMVTPSEWVDAAEMVDDVLQRLETKIRESRAVVCVTGDLPRLFVDRTWATQAIYNLVANALKFTRDNEPPVVEIEAVEIEALEIDKHCPGQATPVAGIVVRDSGPGILPEYRERVFELFQRAVGRDIEGTGAGLAIVRQIARRHGGEVRVESAATGGCEFILTFAIPPLPSMMNKEPDDGHDLTSPNGHCTQSHRDLVGGRQ